jgi:hypothetical protein
MSSATPRRFGRELSDSRVFGRLEALAVRSARFAGFWSAVVLPFALFGLAATGSATDNAMAFSALLVANMVALVLGRQYGRACRSD